MGGKYITHCLDQKLERCCLSLPMLHPGDLPRRCFVPVCPSPSLVVVLQWRSSLPSACIFPWIRVFGRQSHLHGNQLMFLLNLLVVVPGAQHIKSAFFFCTTCMDLFDSSNLRKTSNFPFHHLARRGDFDLEFVVTVTDTEKLSWGLCHVSRCSLREC